MAPGVLFAHLTPALFFWWRLAMFRVIMTGILWDISSSCMDREWSVSLWIFQKNIYMYWQHLFEKLRETETHHLHLCQYNTTPMHSKSNIDYSVSEAQQHFFIRMTILYLATLWSILPTKPMVWLVYFLSVLFQRWGYLLASEDSEEAM